MSGGGGGGPTSQTIYQQSIPKELVPYATRLLGSAQSLAFGTPYQQYPGQQVAGFSPMQAQAFQNIQQMQPSASTGQASALAGLAGTSQWTPQIASQFMSPYIQDVINQQQQGAIRQYANQLPSMAGVATQAGGLGGSRQAIVNAMNQQALQQNLQNIQATGLQNAYQAGQQQYNQQLQNQLAAAGLLGNLGQQQFQQAAGINTALLGAGALQQQQQQTALNTSYQNFLNQMNYPYQQLNFMSGLIRGTPTSNQNIGTYQAPPNMAGQVAGLGLGLGSLFGALG